MAYPRGGYFGNAAYNGASFTQGFLQSYMRDMQMAEEKDRYYKERADRNEQNRLDRAHQDRMFGLAKDKITYDKKQDKYDKEQDTYEREYNEGRDKYKDERQAEQDLFEQDDIMHDNDAMDERNRIAQGRLDTSKAAAGLAAAPKAAKPMSPTQIASAKTQLEEDIKHAGSPQEIAAAVENIGRQFRTSSPEDFRIIQEHGRNISVGKFGSVKGGAIEFVSPWEYTDEEWTIMGRANQEGFRKLQEEAKRTGNYEALYTAVQEGRPIIQGEITKKNEGIQRSKDNVADRESASLKWKDTHSGPDDTLDVAQTYGDESGWLGGGKLSDQDVARSVAGEFNTAAQGFLSQHQASGQADRSSITRDPLSNPFLDRPLSDLPDDESQLLDILEGTSDINEMIRIERKLNGLAYGDY